MASSLAGLAFVGILLYGPSLRGRVPTYRALIQEVWSACMADQVARSRILFAVKISPLILAWLYCGIQTVIYAAEY